MSAGLSLLRAVIASGSRSAVRELNVQLFNEAETPAYRFLTTFYARHGRLPTIEIMGENGFMLPLAEGPVGYFIDRARERVIFNSTQQFMVDAQDALAVRDYATVRQLLATTHREIGRVTGTADTVLIQELMSDVIEDALRFRLAGSTGLTGVTFGYPTMDRFTAGAQGGDLISVVARPNVGKSWTLIHMALEAWRAGNAVVFLTMEMTGYQVARRALGLATGIDPDDLRRGRIAMYAEDLLYDFVEQTQDMPPFHLVHGSFRKTTGDLDRIMQEFTPDIAFADAAYLMTPEAKQRGNASRWEKVYDLGEEMKGIAADRSRPVIQSLQLNRDKKEDTEFDLTQIAGGDVIAQISSLVMAVDFGRGEHKRTQRRNILGKNRDGELGEWTSNFLFSPMNLSEVIVTEQDEATTRQLLQQAI